MIISAFDFKTIIWYQKMNLSLLLHSSEFTCFISNITTLPSHCKASIRAVRAADHNPHNTSQTVISEFLRQSSGELHWCLFCVCSQVM